MVGISFSIWLHSHSAGASGGPTHSINRPACIYIERGKEQMDAKRFRWMKYLGVYFRRRSCNVRMRRLRNAFYFFWGGTLPSLCTCTVRWNRSRSSKSQSRSPPTSQSVCLSLLSKKVPIFPCLFLVHSDLRLKKKKKPKMNAIKAIAQVGRMGLVGNKYSTWG